MAAAFNWQIPYELQIQFILASFLGHQPEKSVVEFSSDLPVSDFAVNWSLRTVSSLSHVPSCLQSFHRHF